MTRSIRTTEEALTMTHFLRLSSIIEFRVPITKRSIVLERSGSIRSTGLFIQLLEHIFPHGTGHIVGSNFETGSAPLTVLTDHSQDGLAVAEGGVPRVREGELGISIHLEAGAAELSVALVQSHVLDDVLVHTHTGLAGTSLLELGEPEALEFDAAAEQAHVGDLHGLAGFCTVCDASTVVT